MNSARTLSLLAVAALGLGLVSCSSTAPSQSRLAPGQYEWHPERSQKGPVLVVVSIDDQMAYHAVGNPYNTPAVTLHVYTPGIR